MPLFNLKKLVGMLTGRILQMLRSYDLNLKSYRHNNGIRTCSSTHLVILSFTEHKLRVTLINSIVAKKLYGLKVKGNIYCNN